MRANLRGLDDNPSPEWKVCECFPLKLLPAPHPTQAPFRFWSCPGHTCHTDDGRDGGEVEDDNDGDSNHSDDVHGGKEEDEDLPNVAVPLRDSAVSLLDIQLEIIAIVILLVILRTTGFSTGGRGDKYEVRILVMVTLRSHSSTSSHCRALLR